MRWRRKSRSRTVAAIVLAVCALAAVGHALPADAAPPASGGDHGSVVDVQRHAKKRTTPQPRRRAPERRRAAATPAPAPAPAPGTTDNGDSQNVVKGIGGDTLTSNGLSSPACRDGSPLTARQAANCEASGSPAVPVPINNYQFDIHINTPTFGVGAADVYVVIQNLIIQPLWMLLLWLTHGVLIALAWTFHLNLFNEETMGPIARALRAGRRFFTDPWLKVALAIGSIPLLYMGVVQRRVGEGLSQLVTMLVMMVLGLFIISHPFGTVGWLANTVQKASLGTVSAFATGDVHRTDVSFNRGLERVFANAIEKPYAYLEFGDVDWGTNPARRDPRLFSDESIKNAAQANVGSVFWLFDPDKELEAKLKTLTAPMEARARAARTNAQLFTSFPANGVARNSINDKRSLFRTLCQPDDDDCTGPTANQANFRKQGQTLSRLGGAILICAGLAGLILLLVFLAYKLLTAALFALFYLLLTPVVVVIAALGEGGQKQFKRWATRLLGAVLAKLLFGVLLGIVFLLVDVLGAMGSLGFWTQWFLIGAFYWMAWLHREELLEFMRLGHRDLGEAGRSAAGGLLAAAMAWRVGKGATRTAKAAIERPTRAAVSVGQRGQDIFRARRSARQLDAGERRQASMQATSATAREDREAQVLRSLDAEAAGHRDTAKPMTALRHRAERFRRGEIAAREAGDDRLANRYRAARNTTEARRALLRRDQPAADASDQHVQDAELQRARTGAPYSEGARRERALWLDRQAETPARPGSAEEVASGDARDYARLAALTDPQLTPQRYAQLPGARQREVQRAADAELAKRRAALTLEQQGNAPTRGAVAEYVRAHGASPVRASAPLDRPRSEQALREARHRRQFETVNRELLDRSREPHARPTRTRRGR
jgi:hypothetical protein